MSDCGGYKERKNTLGGRNALARAGEGRCECFNAFFSADSFNPPSPDRSIGVAWQTGKLLGRGDKNRRVFADFAIF